MKWKFASLIASLALSSYAQTGGKFEVIHYMGMRRTIQGNQGNIVFGEVSNENISFVKSNLAATAINLQVKWWDIETSEGVYNWQDFDNNIDIIMNNKMKVALRINLQTKPIFLRSGINRNIPDDWFMQTQDGHIFNGEVCRYTNEYESACRVYFSYNKAEARSRMVKFVDTVAGRLDRIVKQRGGTNAAILGIAPVFNQQEEAEYPWIVETDHTDVDYSPQAIANFRVYLKTKYKTIGELNAAWKKGGSDNCNYSDFDKIDPKTLNWGDGVYFGNGTKDLSMFKYPVGRIDWLEFKSRALKHFLDELATVIHARKFNTYLQLTPLGAAWSRGWIDYVPLIENYDWVNGGFSDVLSVKQNAIFADYLRTACRYWGWKAGKVKKFVFEGNVPKDVTANSTSWADILYMSRLRGASGTSVVKFNEDLRDTNGFYDAALYNTENSKPFFGSYFAALRNCVRDGALSISKPVNAVHLSTSAIIANRGFIDYEKIYPEAKFTNQYYRDVPTDILSDTMIIAGIKSDGTRFVNEYKSGNIWFPAFSQTMHDRVAEAVLNSSVQNTPMLNGTHFTNGYGQFTTTIGLLSDGINGGRYPARLIWAMRPDIHAIWPNANKCVANSFGVPLELDYNEWLTWVAASTAPEYPGLIPLFAAWDPVIYNIYMSSSDLMGYFPDKYHKVGTTSLTPNGYTFMDRILYWATSTLPDNQPEYPKELAPYKNYPYTNK